MRGPITLTLTLTPALSRGEREAGIPLSPRERVAGGRVRVPSGPRDGRAINPGHHHHRELWVRACLAIVVAHTTGVDKPPPATCATMPQLRHALRDGHYRLIEPLLPTNGRPGHPWRGHRVVLD